MRERGNAGGQGTHSLKTAGLTPTSMHRDSVATLRCGVASKAEPAGKGEPSTAFWSAHARALRPFEEGILLLDQDYRVRACNVAAASLLRRHVSEILGQAWSQFCLCPSTNGRERDELGYLQVPTAATDGADGFTIKIALPDKNPEELLASCQSLATGDDSPGRLIVVLRKPHDRKLDLKKTDVMELLSHDIQGPLTVIKGYATALLSLEETMSPAQRRNYLRKLDRSIQRLSRELRNFLQASRLDGGALKLDREVLLFTGLVRSAVRALREQDRSRRIPVRVSPSMPVVYVDGELMEHVMLNLLSNAVTYSNGQPVSVRVLHIKDPQALPREVRSLKPSLESVALPTVLVAVTDKGPGIPESELPLVFGKFYRGDGDKIRHTVGSGLGLYVTKRILEAHQVPFGIQSQEGKGTTFFFCLQPAADARPAKPMVVT